MKIKKEILLHLVFLFSLATLLFFPVIRSASFSPKDSFYTGFHGIVGDYYTYLSVINQGRNQWSYQNPYTTELTQKNYAHLFYILLGKIASPLRLSNIAMYYLAIIVSFLLYYLFTYLLVVYLVPRKFRWLAMLVIFFAGPLPPSTLSLGSAWWTHMDSYSRVSLVPHHFFSSALLVGTIYYLLRFFYEKKTRFLLFSLLLQTIGLLSFAVPGFTLLTAILVSVLLYLILHCIRRSIRIPPKVFWGFVLVIFLSLFLLFLVRQLLTAVNFPDWEYQTYRQEQLVYTYSHLFFSYGILLILILPSFVLIIRKKRFSHFFLFLLLILPSIFYQLAVAGILPINKLRFVYSAPYAIGGILATLGIAFLLDHIKGRLTRRLILGGIVCIVLTNAFFGLKAYWLPKLSEKKIDLNTYIPKPYIQAMEYLVQETPPASAVLTTYLSGMFIPAFTYNRVYLGHEIITFEFWRKWHEVDAFYNEKMSLQKAKDLFSQNSIDYVFSEGKKLTPYKSILIPVWTNKYLTIYKTI